MAEHRPDIQNAKVELRLLATTDLHMHLTCYDYASDRSDPSYGLTRTATLIEQARAEAEERGALTFLFDNGDGLQGAPLDDPDALRDTRSHPLVRAFDHLAYDAIGLGNHDFNFGLEALHQALHDIRCPVICSNLRAATPGTELPFQQFAVFERDTQFGPLKIGVLSLLPPQTIGWDSHWLSGRVTALPIVDSARCIASDLRAEGCDLVIALAHSGIGPPEGSAGQENAVIPLAALDNIDAIIAGHTHLRLPGPDHADLPGVDALRGRVHGKPVVMPGSSGSHLGMIDLSLRPGSDGTWRIIDADCRLRPISVRDDSGIARPCVPESPTLVDILADDHAATLIRMRRKIGHTPESLHSYFSFLAPDRALTLIAAAQAATVRPWLAASGLRDLPLLSAAAPAKFGARAGPDWYTDIPPGPVLARHLADLVVFPNELRLMILSGRDIADWLENSANVFHRICPGSRETELLNPAIPGHDFDTLFGLTYEIDVSAPAFAAPQKDGSMSCGRIRKLSLGNRPLRADDALAVVLNSFRAGGAGPFDNLDNARHIPVPEIAVVDALTAYLSDHSPRDPLHDAPPPWRLAPVEDATALYLTGPGATEHMAELEGRGIVADGIDKDGFLRLIVPL